MLGFLKLRKRGPEQDADLPPSAVTSVPAVTPQPARPLYVIGDVHGAMPALDHVLRQIDAHLHSNKVQTPLMVLVGDLIDRGDHSAQVLARVQNLCTHLGDNVVCLMGNHERMMLDFLDDPVGRGPRWLRNGGLQTLASFGVRGLSQNPSDAELQHMADGLRAAMPAGQEDWMRALPLSHLSGNVLCVHAAADPDLPAQTQPDKVLIWGKGTFLTTPRRDGICVVHGHTVVDNPERHATRIAVDTGAYFSGQLTAAAIGTDGTVTFLTSGS